MERQIAQHAVEDRDLVVTAGLHIRRLHIAAAEEEGEVPTARRELELSPVGLQQAQVWSIRHLR